MKYNTISTSSLSSEGKKSTLTIYTDPDFINEKTTFSEVEMASVRGELEIVQRALKLQTKRCRQLVAEYTKRLQEKEQQYQSERYLRSDQLAKVLRALLIFEARLKQEQKFISHQLEEKDYLIEKQNNEISKLMSNQYCKHCNQIYSPVCNLESLDSSSDYVVTDYHDYQSSTMESLDSSSETYATISEKDFNKKSCDVSLSSEEQNENKKCYQKNKFSKESIGKRGRKFTHKKSIGTYFEVLKLRNESPLSNEDNTCNDYENFESLGTEKLSDKISTVSDRIDNIFNSNSNCSSNDSDCNNTVIRRNIENESCNGKSRNVEISAEIIEPKLTTAEFQAESMISESIPVFEAGEQETNDKWYVSGSDQEDEEHTDLYRNNPVLECMNQILLQNINDTNSPPKTPNVERKFPKNKKVKFSDEEEKEEKTSQGSNYYETPIQKQPNFYETPQSIYSNDYEQILSQSNDSVTGSLQEKEVNILPTKRLSVLKNVELNKSPHYYDMDAKPSENDKNDKIIRKSKILRTPPALPPKPTNLVSKYKLQMQNKINLSSEPAIESEPDYCSISELNLPVKNTKQKINVIAEINIPNILENSKDIIVHIPKSSEIESVYDPVDVNEEIASLVCKNIEKFSIQLAKQTQIRTENTNTSPLKSKIKEPEIPKLPQVSEIIIPEENENGEEEEHINHDNYVKNNSQILKVKNRTDNLRRPIVMGKSVSSLITGFNNQQLLSEIQQKPEKPKKMFSSFENFQNCEKQTKKEEPTFEKFDLSQTFEEFKLEDCEILEEYDIDSKSDVMERNITPELVEHKLPESPKSPSTNSTRVELVRATNNVSIPPLNVNSIQHLRKKLELQKSNEALDQIYKSNAQINSQNEPTYEHFLECTGLSSKSILTPSRLMSNHKSMLKPKDVKLRSKVKSTNVLERNGSTKKYWSEPYV